MNKRLIYINNNKGVTVMKSKSIILLLVGAAFLSIIPAISQSQTATAAKQMSGATPSHVVLHSMRARRFHAEQVTSAAVTTGMKNQGQATAPMNKKEQVISTKGATKKALAKTAKRKTPSSKKMTKKALARTAKSKASSSKLAPRTKHTSHKHPSVKKSSTNS
jgi:hypothetical protein